MYNFPPILFGVHEKRSCTHQNCSRAMVAIMLQELSLFSTNAIYWKTCCFIQGILIPIKLIARALDHLRTHHFFQGFFREFPSVCLRFGPCFSFQRTHSILPAMISWGMQLEQKSEFKVQLQRASMISKRQHLWPIHSYHFLNFRGVWSNCVSVFGYLLQLIEYNKLPHTKTKER